MNKNECQFVEDLKTGCLLEGDFLETLDEEKTKNLLKNLSDFLNNFSFKVEPVVDEISKDSFSSGYFYETCVLWTAYLYRCFKEKKFDFRNEESVKRGKIIYEETGLDTGLYLEKVSDLEDLKDEDFLPERIVYHMSREHRTIQQTFSKMVFYFLANKTYPSLREDIQKLIKEGKLFHDFWYLPLV